MHWGEGREGGPWHGADSLPCWWALQGSPLKCAYWADSGRAGQAHELHVVVSGKMEGVDRESWAGQTEGGLQLQLWSCLVLRLQLGLGLQLGLRLELRIKVVLQPGGVLQD